MVRLESIRLPGCILITTKCNSVSVYFKMTALSPTNTHLVFSFVWPGKSRLEYCLDSALRSPSPLPRPPWAGSNVGRAAVVILLKRYAFATFISPIWRILSSPLLLYPLIKQAYFRTAPRVLEI